MKKNDYIVILAPMITELGLQGNSLLVFAMIHGFSKDGNHKFIGSFQYIADWLNVSIRSVKEIVSLLVDDGYVAKTKERDDHNRPINAYLSNYDELLARVAAGEEVKPSSIKGRRGCKKVNSAQCAPIITTDAIGAQSDISSVHKLPFIGAQNARNNNYTDKYIDNNSLSESAHAREAEEREFLKIFFKRNAADPAAEVMRFTGWYQSKGWTDGKGRTYDTTEKRCGLAWPWEIKTGSDRLPAGPDTETFLAFCCDLSDVAAQLGGIHPKQLLDPLSSYKIDPEYGFTWKCRRAVYDWFDTNKKHVVHVYRKHYSQTNLHFEFY